MRQSFKGTLASVAVLSGLLACSSPLEPLAEDTPRSATAQFLHEGVRIGLETFLSHLYLHPGDSVTVTTTVRNLGDEAVTFDFNYGCPFRFVVTDSAGRVLVGNTWSCLKFTFSHLLAPGEELSATRYWDGQRPWGEESRPVRPGIYHVWGVFHWYAPAVPLEVRKPRLWIY